MRPDKVLQCSTIIAIPHSISPQDYLDLDSRSETLRDRQKPIRHEYRQRLVYAMTGGGDGA
ncbi:hypothetical protein [Spirulina subsalsa]|uniref:hypothetical protein n=1 Tax=Spirulina subsalsa TaxID=54311 RepID=UPI0002EF9963|nr:hypothetical protein [Spirulina subsalsa]